MRIIETKVYPFDELTDEGKAKAVDNLRDINADYDWWDAIYEDARTIGLTITEFDIYHREINGELTEGANATAKLILDNHGESTPTYKLAQDWFADKRKDYMTSQGELDLAAMFQRDLLNRYLNNLTDDYHYLQTDEAVIETIEANEYEFTADGKLI